MGRIRQRLARKASKLAWVPSSVPDFMWQIISEAEMTSTLRCPNPSLFTWTDCVYLKAGTGRPLHCKQNVAQFIAQNPGCSAQDGEILWWNPQNGDITREEHVVVRMPEGGLLDVTSYFGSDKQICFVPKAS
jgi:hypothetical protein